MNLKFNDFFVLLSSIGILSLGASDFYGGMIFNLWYYYEIFVPIIILFIAAIIILFVSLIKKGIKKNRIKLIIIAIVLLCFTLLKIHRSEYFKSKHILSANKDLYYWNYNLILRKNGKCEIIVTGTLGSFYRHKGKYHLNGDTLVFYDFPYLMSSDSFNDTMIINRADNTINFHFDNTISHSDKKEIHGFKIEYRTKKAKQL